MAHLEEPLNIQIFVNIEQLKESNMTHSSIAVDGFSTLLPKYGNRKNCAENAKRKNGNYILKKYSDTKVHLHTHEKQFLAPLYGCSLGAGESSSADAVRVSVAKL